MACIADCMTGDDKITTLSLKGKVDKDDYHRHEPGMTCKASAFYGKTTMIVGTIATAIAATQSSHIPQNWLIMSQFLEYNAVGSGAEVLDQLTQSTDYSVGAGAMITFFSFISWIGSVKPVSLRCQYFLDVICYTLACGLSVFMFLKLLVDDTSFQFYCSNSMPGVVDNPSMHSGTPGYDAFCGGCVRRAWLVFILFGALMGCTGLAWISNWCGLFCKCCMNGDKSKQEEE
jgi:hypothetical protein